MPPGASEGQFYSTSMYVVEWNRLEYATSVSTSDVANIKIGPKENPWQLCSQSALAWNPMPSPISSSPVLGFFKR
jgi:hypothetical protein